MDLIILILFIFWIIAVVKRFPIFTNFWFISNSNRKVFKPSDGNNLASTIKKALIEEFKKKKKYYKNFFFS